MITHGDLEGEKVDVGKFGSPPSYHIVPSNLRMIYAKMCGLDTGCRGAFLHTTCSVNAQHRDDTVFFVGIPD